MERAWHGSRRSELREKSTWEVRPCSEGAPQRTWALLPPGLASCGRRAPPAVLGLSRPQTSRWLQGGARKGPTPPPPLVFSAPSTLPSSTEPSSSGVHGSRATSMPALTTLLSVPVLSSGDYTQVTSTEVGGGPPTPQTTHLQFCGWFASRLVTTFIECSCCQLISKDLEGGGSRVPFFFVFYVGRPQTVIEPTRGRPVHVPGTVWLTSHMAAPWALATPL